MPIRLLVAAAAASLLCLLAGSAFAAPSVTLPNETAVEREEPLRTGAGTQGTFWISYSDCVADDELTFPLLLTEFLGLSLQVWVGDSSANCLQPEQRTGANARCWQIYEDQPMVRDPDVVVRAQDIVGRHLPPNGGRGSGTEEDCEKGDGTTTEVTLYFMLIRSGTVAGESAQWTRTNIDLFGPPAPTAVDASSGENQLFVTWTTMVANDNAGFRLFCDPPPGSVQGPPLGTLQVLDAGFRLEGGAFDASGPGAPDASRPSTGGDAGPFVPGADGGATQDPSCRSDVLVPGERPPIDLVPCGSAGRIAERATASGLQNNVLYAVGVAAIDQVGNRGPLSSLACEQPLLVDDFYELYRDAGGSGGGGFCSIGAGPNGSWAFIAVAAAALALRRRRR